jgi:hypothetical protein
MILGNNKHMMYDRVSRNRSLKKKVKCVWMDYRYKIFDTMIEFIFTIFFLQGNEKHIDPVHTNIG